MQGPEFKPSYHQKESSWRSLQKPHSQEIKKWNEILKMLKRKTKQSRILNVAKLPFKIKRVFLDKQKLLEFVASRPAL
jgi:hypothetical protein